MPNPQTGIYVDGVSTLKCSLRFLFCLPPRSQVFPATENRVRGCPLPRCLSGIGGIIVRIDAERRRLHFGLRSPKEEDGTNVR
jgi:hypothetical protein